jgi:hypothetical protein
MRVRAWNGGKLWGAKRTEGGSERQEAWRYRLQGRNGDIRVLVRDGVFGRTRVLIWVCVGTLGGDWGFWKARRKIVGSGHVG